MPPKILLRRYIDYIAEIERMELSL